MLHLLIAMRLMLVKPNQKEAKNANHPLADLCLRQKRIRFQDQKYYFQHVFPIITFTFKRIENKKNVFE